MASRKTLKSAIESMMFIWGEPLAVKDIADVFNVDKKEVHECCRELMEEYEQEGRGIVIRQVGKAFQFTTRAENLPYIERLCTPTRHRRLSQSALETLAIVAYRQPVTKGEIESIRGIRCDRVMEGLARKGLVREVGRAETVGRPILYGTTDEFLKQFGFETIKDLPAIQDIEGLLEADLAEDAQDSLSMQQITLEDLATGATGDTDIAGQQGADDDEVTADAGATEVTDAAGLHSSDDDEAAADAGATEVTDAAGLHSSDDDEATADAGAADSTDAAGLQDSEADGATDAKHDDAAGAEVPGDVSVSSGEEA